MSAAGLLLLLASTLVTAPHYGFDELRRPVAMLGVALLLAGMIARVRRGEPSALRPAKLRFLVDAAVILHVVSVPFATSLFDAGLAFFPIVAAYVVFRATAEGGIPRAFIETWGLPLLAVLALVFCGVGLAVPVSTLGNTNLAGILAAAFATACLAGTVWARPAMGVLFGIATVVSVLHIHFSGSRAAMLGLLAGAAAVAMTRVSSKRIRVAIGTAGVLGLVAGLAMFAAKPDRTAQIRLGIWKGTMKLVGSHPVIGVGAGNFKAAFPPHRDADERRISLEDKDGAHAEVEDAHNTPLHILAEAGPLALLALAGALGAALYLGAGTFDLLPPDRRIVPAAGLAGLACLAVSGMFNTLSVHLPFAILAGLFAGFCVPIVPTKEKLRVAPHTQIAVLVAGAVLCLGAFMYAAADSEYVRGMLKGEKPRLEHMTTALDILEGHPRARYEAAVSMAVLNDREGAAKNLRILLKTHPNHVSALVLLANVSTDPAEAESARARLAALNVNVGQR